MRNNHLEEAASISRFPVAFRLPAFAFRSSDSRRGVGPSSRSAYGASRPDLDGVTTFRTHELRRGGSPSTPRTAVLSRPSRLLDRHWPLLLSGQSLYPAPTSHRAGCSVTRHQRGFTQLTRPVLPSPVAARVERAPFGFPPSFAPRRHRQRTSRVETGLEARTWNYSLNITSG